MASNSPDYHINKHLQIFATLCHAQVISEQNASKTVKKNILTDGEVMSKIKVASFFLGHGHV